MASNEINLFGDQTIIKEATEVTNIKFENRVSNRWHKIFRTLEAIIAILAIFIVAQYFIAKSKTSLEML